MLKDTLAGLGGQGTLIIHNERPSDALIKVILSKQLVASFYVRGAQKFKFDHVPDGSYEILYCTGYGWQGSIADFTRGRHAVRFDSELKFAIVTQTEGGTTTRLADIMTLTLKKDHSGMGNATSTEIPLEEFDRY